LGNFTPKNFFVEFAPVFTALVNFPTKEIYTPAGVMVVVIIDVMVDEICMRLLSIDRAKVLKF